MSMPIPKKSTSLSPYVQIQRHYGMIIIAAERKSLMFDIIGCLFKSGVTMGGQNSETEQ